MGCGPPMDMKVARPVIPSGARNLLLTLFSQKQIPRRCAPLQNNKTNNSLLFCRLRISTRADINARLDDFRVSAAKHLCFLLKTNKKEIVRFAPDDIAGEFLISL
jgi:hypothetical protein